MRRIDPHKIKADPKWDAEAKLAKEKVANGAKLSDYGHVWRDTKDRLKYVSNGKCWYCEARQDRSDNAVDHYRPKSLYPWLAFNLDNFRFACTFCNSIRTNPETGEAEGKGDYFPLFCGERAASYGDLNTEDRVLLDPCVSSDPMLLDFLDDGSPCPKYPAEQKKRNERAIQSIRYFHLDHPALNEARRGVALKLTEWIKAADGLYSKSDQGSLQNEATFSVLIATIGQSIVDGAEFSVFARRIVEGHRDKDWVNELLMYA
jgi:uncharacterized protein (TIGR02646 family)